MKLAYSIQDLIQEGPLGKTSIYEAIGSGRLRAKKYGKRTLVRPSDWDDFLNGLPDFPGTGGHDAVA